MWGDQLNSVHRAKEKATGQIDSPSAQIFSSLIKSLEQSENFPLSNLYILDHDDFDLAVNVIKDWRLARYYMGNDKPFHESLSPSS